MRLLIVFLLSSNAIASEKCCVDEDIAAAFDLHQSFSREWPEDFPLRLNHEGFGFIGSSKYDHTQYQSVAWRAEMDPEAARGVVIDALLAADWVPMPEFEHARSSSERGFIPHQRRNYDDNQQFCRGRDGILSVKARQSDIGTVVAVAHNDDRRSRNCAAAIAERSDRRGHHSGMMDYLPALMLPETLESDHGGGASGGGDEAHSAMSVTTAVPAADVSFHFEPQMQSQDWVLDTAFQGRKSAGHIWRRTVDGLELVCVVTVIETEDGLHLRMIVQAN